MSSLRPVYIHIGLQKTGTSYLQSIFWQSQDALKEQGLDMVPGSKRQTFHLMLCVRGRFNAEFDPPEVAGALDALPGQLRRVRGSRALISEESLAPANDRQIAALLKACEQREVHLIVTLRDLGRQIPSAWQQLLQSGGSMTFDSYLRRLKKTEGRPSAKHWANKDLNEILDRWSAHIPEERIHLVTVPPPGNQPELLLRRFCEVIDIDADTLNREVGRLNESVGRTQAELLSRVNGKLSKTDRRRDVYGDIGKRYFAVTVLGAQGGDRIVIPARYRDWVHEVSQKFIARIAAGRFQVIGDLEDLRPSDATFARGSVRPSDDEVAEVAAAALAQMLSERMDTQRKRRAKGGAPGASGWSRLRLKRRGWAAGR